VNEQVRQPLQRGLLRRHRHLTAGNGALLVIVDSGGPYWERSIIAAVGIRL
jgi:hypothetical protein